MSSSENANPEQKVASTPTPTPPVETNGVPPSPNVVGHSELHNYLVHLAAREVEAELRTREERRAKTWNILVIALGVVGLGGVKAGIDSSVRAEMATYDERQKSRTDEQRVSLEAMVEKRTAEAVTGAVADLRDELKNQTDYQELTYLAYKLRSGEGFTDEDRDAALRLLRRISESSTYRTRPEFVGLLEAILDAFMQADQRIQYIEAIELFPEEVLSHPVLYLTLIQYMGLRVLGSPKHPDDVEDDQLLWLSRAVGATRADSVGVADAYGILLEFKRAGSARNDVVSRMFSGLAELDETERKRAHDVFWRYNDWRRIQRKATPEGVELQRLTNELWRVYGKEIATLAADDEPATPFSDIFQFENQGLIQEPLPQEP